MWKGDRLRLHRAAAIAAALASSAASGRAPPLLPPVNCDPFLIPFAWDSAEIPAHIEAMLENVVLACAHSACQRVVLTAHADSSGSRAYNARLSQRRARAIATFLERRELGVPITIEVVGEDRLANETADGVREPRNRFVIADTCPAAEVPDDERPGEKSPPS